MMKADSTNLYYRLLLVLLVVFPVRCFLPEKTRLSLSLSLSKMRARSSVDISVGISSSRIAASRTREDADLLPLSSFDRGKFHHMKTRGRVMPIIVMGEPILPGQRLYFRSGDPKFEELIKYIAQVELDYANSGGKFIPNIEIGILGFDPQSGQPLQIGVTSHVQTKKFAYSLTAENRDRAITTSFCGARIFRLVSNPWMDPTGSFHMARVDILDGRYDDETRRTTKRLDTSQIESDELFAQIPGYVDEWMELMFEAGLATPASLAVSQKEIIATQQHQQPQLQMEDDPRHRTRRRNSNYALYPPRRQADRAIWVAALLNPIRRYPVAVSGEIRPAFLACRNDRDRLDLCIVSLRLSIEFLEIYLDTKKRGGSEKDGNADGVGR
jgi:hypothetical protein